MRHGAVLAAALCFVALLTALVIDDIAVYGVHLVDVVAIVILGLVGVTILGSLFRRPPRQ